MKARLRALVTLPMPNRAGWHQAIRMTAAALLTDIATAVAGLPQGYWAVITCLIIVQGSLGATIAAGIARMAGTVAGVILGGVGVMLLRLFPHLPEWAVLLIVIAPLAVLAASRPLFRMAPLTGALVLLLAGSGNLTFALYRIAEIALGCGIGVLVSLFVLPERATAVLMAHAAAILDLLGDYAVVLIAEKDAAATEIFALKVRHAFLQIQNDMKEVDHERSVKLLRSDPFPERLLRHLQRLRTDVNMLGRAVAPRTDDLVHAELASAIKGQFEALAAALRGQDACAPAAPLDQSMLAAAQAPLGFALATLQREFAELNQMLKERAAPEEMSGRGY